MGPADEGPSVALGDDTPAGRYVAAVRAGDYVRAREVTQEALDSGTEPVYVLTDVIAAAMRRIGDLWENGVINTADEHLATAITERVLADLYPSLCTSKPLSRESLLVASVHRDTHVLGSRMIADVLEGSGFRVIFLGGDLPNADLIAAIERHRPAALLLGATSPWSGEELHTALRQIREREPELPVLAGGPASRSVFGEPGLTMVVDATEVVAAVEEALPRASEPA